MPMRIDEVVPWGRSLEEYVAMFNLTPQELGLRILDCGGGPASFNAELTERGGNVISCDPIYRFGGHDIARRVRETYPVMLRGVEEEKARFVWTRIASPAALGQLRLRAMQRFLQDFEAGLAEARYRADSLPDLPFQQGAFDLALCSHLLFLYSAQLNVAFHVASIRELLRVSSQVRVFPLLDMDGKESAHLPEVIETLERTGFCPRLQRVPYEFQKGGDRMLVVEGGGRASC